MDYHTIKRLAGEMDGVTVGDLIALAPQNDPFYVGTAGDVEKAQWFAGLWHEFGYTSGVHLRRVHYRLVSQDPPVIKPTGDPYQNTDRDWDYLNMASKCARYLGLVRPGAFVDRRNPDPHIYARNWHDATPRCVIESEGGLDIDLPEFPSNPHFAVHGYDRESDSYETTNLQRYLVEVWCEKSTMNDVLLPLCQKYDANLVTGAGEMSITAALDFVRRVEEMDKPARILYIADFDPAGYGMPVGVSRKVEFFLDENGLDLDIVLEPIALTGDQVREYDLPRTPIKRSELRRKSFIEAQGQGAVELDALEAIHPGLLAQIVEESILRYYDDTIQERAREERAALDETLGEAEAQVMEPWEEELDELEDAFRLAVSAFEEEIRPVQERLNAIYPRLVDALQAVEVDMDEYPLPEPEEGEEFNNPLYTSRRDYIEQLKAYKLYQNGGK